eukprot:gene28856-biopygen24733
MGQTAVVTFTLSELATDFAASDITVMGGTLSGFAQSATNPLVYTATFTPAAGSMSGAVYVASNRFSDASGNFNADGNDANNATTFTLDIAPPTIAITSDKSILKAADTATITFTLSEISTNFDASDIAVTGGTLSGFAQSASNPYVYTAIFTPAAGSTGATVSVASNKFSDAGGNQNQDGADANNTVSLTVDQTPPTIIVSSPKSSLGAGETATVTFTLSEASSNFTLDDITVVGGTLSNFTGSGTSYSATFTPTAGASTASVKVDSNKFTDAAGNQNADGADANNTVSFNLDVTPPTIIVSSDKTDLLAGETATITFTLSEASNNFTASDVTVNGGTLSGFVQSATNPLVYTATFTPTSTAASAMILVSSNTFSDAAGNLNKDGSDLNNAVALKTNCPPPDTAPPTIAITSDKTDLLVGQTATITFTLSEASSDFTASDITVNGGTLSGFVQSATNPLVYTATFTPTSTAASAMILVSSNTFSDAAGNLNKDGSDLNNAVALKTNCPPPDTAPPTIAISTDKTALGTGQTAMVTFTLSEASSDFTATDITVMGGTLSGFAQSATNPLVYTATFTPAAGSISGAVYVSSNKFSDAAGNFNADGNDANNAATFSIDATPPTIAISTDKVDLLVGQTATITFTLSEASNNFTASDITVNGGTLTGFAQSATNPLVYTATFTPTSTGASAMILVSSNTFSDAAGNLNKDGADLNNAVALKTNCPPADSTPPSIVISSNKVLLDEGETASINFTLSEASTDFTLGDITCLGGTLSNLQGSGTSYTATFTPFATAKSAALFVASYKFSDAAGNFNLDGADVNNAVSLGIHCEIKPTTPATPADTTAPTIAISSAKALLAQGETTTVTFTLSEDSSDFSLADITLLGGTLSNFAGSGKVYTATFTPNATAKSAALFVSSDKFTDAAGNLNKDGSDNNNAASFAINCTPVPPAPLTPPAPSVVVAPGGITTPDTTPTFQGTGTPGNTIQIKDPAGNVIGSAVVGPNGQWNVTPTAPLPQGSNNLSITETSPSGAVSPSVPLPVVIDSVAPSAPSGAIAPGSNTGSTTDNITSNNKPTLTGTGTPGDTIKITDPQGNVIGTAVVGPNGQWSITPTTALPTGTNNLSMVAIDPAGNVSPTAPLPVVIESGSLPAPTGGINPGSNTGSTTDNITTNPQPVLSGTGQPGDTIKITDPAGNVIGSAVVGPNGQWNVTPTAPLPQGLNNLSITETSPSGAVSPSVPLPVVIDSVGPSAPSGTFAPGSNSGSTTDNITSVTQPTLTGTGTPGDTIKITDPQGNVIGSAIVGPNGQWSLAPTNPLPQGQNNLSIVAVDPAGNVSPPTPLPIFIDTVAPTIALSSNKTLLGNGESVTVTFTLSEASSDFTLADITAMGGTLSNFQGSGTTYFATFTPNAGATSAALLVTSDKFSDAAGNLNKDGSDLNNALSFSVSAVVVPAPAAPSGTLAPSSNSGSLTDNVTIDTTPTITGVGTPGDTIKITDPQGNVIGTAIVAPNGSWSITPTTPLPQGNNNLAITEITPDGQTSPATILPIVIDSVAPLAPTAGINPASNSGSLTDNVTIDTTPTIDGTGTPGDTIKITDPQGNLIGTAIVGPNGQWSITPTTPLPTGTNNLSVTEIDPAGNISPAVPLPIVIETAVSAAPALVVRGRVFAGPIAATSATTEVVDAQNLIPDINTLQTSASTSVTSTGGINLVQPKEVAVSLPTGTPTVIATNPPVITESSVSSVAPPPGAMNDGMILTPPSLTGNPSVTSGTGSTATGGGTLPNTTG